MSLALNLPKLRYKYISVYDDAVEIDEKEKQSYIETLDRSKLKLNGKTTDEIEIRPLAAKEKNQVLSYLYDKSYDDVSRNFAMSYAAVEFACLSHKAEEFPYEVIIELGEVVFNVSSLPFHSGRTSDV